MFKISVLECCQISVIDKVHLELRGTLFLMDRFLNSASIVSAHVLPSDNISALELMWVILGIEGFSWSRGGSGVIFETGLNYTMIFIRFITSVEGTAILNVG